MIDEPAPASEPAAEAAITPAAEPFAPAAGPDVPPNHIAVDPRNEFFSAELLQRGVGIRFKGKVRRDIEEYCIDEGWVRVQAGKSMDRHGRPLLLKLTGPVEAWFEDLGENPPVAKL